MSNETYFVKNVSDSIQSVVAIGSFNPGEVKEVSYNKKQRLLRNPNFEIVDPEPVLEEIKTTKKTSDATKK